MFKVVVAHDRPDVAHSGAMDGLRDLDSFKTPCNCRSILHGQVILRGIHVTDTVTTTKPIQKSKVTLPVVGVELPCSFS